MNTRKEQKGFSPAEVLIVVAIIALLGFLGYLFINQQDKTARSNEQELSQQSPTATNVPAAPEINSADDLDKALHALEQSDPSKTNDNDMSKLKGELSSF